MRGHLDNATNAIRGDGTGNVLRAIGLDIQPGATPGTNIDITHDGSLFNVPTITNATDLAAGGTSGSFALSANGQVITVDLDEDVVGVLSTSIIMHDINSSSGSELYLIQASPSGNNILLDIRLRPGQAQVDWRTIMDAGDRVIVQIAFITST